MKEIKGSKEEDKTPPAWFTSYMEKVGFSMCLVSDGGSDNKSTDFSVLHGTSSKTRWCVRRWRRSAGSSPDSAASISPWVEEVEEQGGVEGK